MFRHAQNIALNWFKHNKKNPSFWDKHFPANFPFDREASINKEIKVMMYPYRTKCDLNTKNTVQIIEWSKTELYRVLQYDYNDLMQAKERLKEVESRKTENENRKILKERDANKQKEIISKLENKINNKIKTSLYNIKPFEAGYQIDIDKSLELNLKHLHEIEYKSESSKVMQAKLL